MAHATGWIYVFGCHNYPVLKVGWKPTLPDVEQAFQAYQSDNWVSMECTARVQVQDDIEDVYHQVRIGLDRYIGHEDVTDVQAILDALVTEAIQGLLATCGCRA